VGLIGIFAVLGTLLVSSPAPSPAPTARVLNVAWHHQEHNLSCEAAALKMALSYYGIKTGELTLIRYMTQDSRRAQFGAGGRLTAWGDPAYSYVGNPDGNIHRYQGYGVYFQPVALAAMYAGASVLQAGSGLYGRAVSPADVYRAVLAGHPVVAWISNTYHQVKLSSYTSYEGETVRYTLTEHAITIVGVRPDAVLINDPWFGRGWHPKAQFESAFRTFAGMAVVVGP
jgi:uncharacterized protein YvpB